MAPLLRVVLPCSAPRPYKWALSLSSYYSKKAGTKSELFFFLTDGFDRVPKRGEESSPLAGAPSQMKSPTTRIKSDPKDFETLKNYVKPHEAKGRTESAALLIWFLRTIYRL
jgi:hypothetical protein